MYVMIRVTIPNAIYRFYQEASCHIANSSPEKIMSDALCAYADLLTRDPAKEQPDCPEDQTD